MDFKWRNEFFREIFKRGFLKRKAATTYDFKDERNKENNSNKKAKQKYFSEKLDASVKRRSTPVSSKQVSQNKST